MPHGACRLKIKSTHARSPEPWTARAQKVDHSLGEPGRIEREPVPSTPACLKVTTRWGYARICGLFPEPPFARPITL